MAGEPGGLSGPVPAADPNRDPATGRFLKGNRARNKHNLRARAPHLVGGRHSRAGWATRRLSLALGQAGRKLAVWEVERARRFCEMGIVATDAWNELDKRGFPTKDEGCERLWEIYRAAVREQGNISRELGLTPAAEQSLRVEVEAEADRRELIKLYGRGKGSA